MSIADTFKAEFADLLVGVEHIWTDDILPELSKFGAWGIAVSKNIVYDLEESGAAGLALAKSMTGAALASIWSTIMAQTKTFLAANGSMSWTDKLSGIRDILLSTVSWGSVEDIAIKIGSATLTTIISGFMSMLMAGVVS